MIAYWIDDYLMKINKKKIHGLFLEDPDHGPIKLALKSLMVRYEDEELRLYRFKVYKVRLAN